MKRPEQQMQKDIIGHLKVRGVPGMFWWHHPAGGWRSPIEAAIFKSLGAKAGIPDLLFLYQGRLYALELKDIGKKSTALQLEVQAEMRFAGAVVGEAAGLDAALVWLESHGLLKGSVQGRAA